MLRSTISFSEKYSQRGIVVGIWSVRIGDAGEGLRPRQGRTFALIEIRRFMPHRQHVESLLCLTKSPGLLCIEVNAIDAAIDLGDSNLDESAKKRLKRA
jgi:hypothetical protein